MKHPSHCIRPVVLGLCLLSGVWNPFVSAAAETKSAKQSAGNAFFDGPIQKIDITLAKPQWDALSRETRQYVKASVTVGDRTYPDVGIHVKGAAGSSRPLDQNPALTLNFNKFVRDQDFQGLDKIHLNNSVQDPTLMTEYICAELFRKAGIPCPRVTHARISLNGRNLGLYVVKEGFDKGFLKQNFKSSKGNLYDGGFLREITDDLQKTSGPNPNDRSDLKALADAANERDLPKRVERLQALLDLDQFVTYNALDVMVWNWDGYGKKRNNYRIYHDPGTGKMTFLTTGMDQMFWEPGGSIAPDFEGLVARSVMQVPEFRQRYFMRVAELLTNVFKIDAITNRMNWLETRIDPALAEFDKGAAANQRNAANDLRNKIIQRAANIRQQLDHQPKPVRFDPSGVATVGNWLPGAADANVRHEEALVDGRKALRMNFNGSARINASWRTSVPLPPGRYRFEGNICTSRVPKTSDDGAVLRISGVPSTGLKRIAGDTGWTPLHYDFDLANDQDVVLVCELRGSKGEASFDLGSLRIVRVTK